MPYAISLKTEFYAQSLSHPWTIQPDLATQWSDRAMPDGIIAYWNKLHYEREITIEDKTRIIHSGICGKCPLGAVVVEVQ